MKKLAIVIFLLVTLQSCFSNCNEIKLTKADKVWLKPYSTVDTILFKSDKNRIDTFALNANDRIYEGYTTCSKFELGPNIYNYSGISFRSNKHHGSSSCRLSIQVTKDHQEPTDLECIKEFEIFDLNASFVNDLDSSLKMEYLTLSINNRKTKTYFFTLGDNFSNNYSGNVMSFNWSKKYGLVRYVLFTGETYNLYKKW